MNEHTTRNQTKRTKLSLFHSFFYAHHFFLAWLAFPNDSPTEESVPVLGPNECQLRFIGTGTTYLKHFALSNRRPRAKISKESKGLEAYSVSSMFKPITRLTLLLPPEPVIYHFLGICLSTCSVLLNGHGA